MAKIMMLAPVLRRVFAIGLLIVAAYPLWIISERWIAWTHYREHYGPADPGPWVTLGLDTVSFGFGCLFVLGLITWMSYSRARLSGDIFSRRLSLAVLGVVFGAVLALVALILLPTTTVS